MRSTMILAALAAAATACSPGIRVRTEATPDAQLTGQHTFRVLAAPQRARTAPSLSSDDPMLANSLTNQQLRADLMRGLEAKGYAQDSANPDFLVAYYAGTKEKMDTTYWNPNPYWRYNYWGHRYWAWPWYPAPSVGNVAQLEPYTQGSLIIDIVDPKTHQLIWRGQGVARVSDDPSQYQKELSQSVDAVLAKFPSATPLTS